MRACPFRIGRLIGVTRMHVGYGPSPLDQKRPEPLLKQRAQTARRAESLTEGLGLSGYSAVKDLGENDR